MQQTGNLVRIQNGPARCNRVIEFADHCSCSLRSRARASGASAAARRLGDVPNRPTNVPVIRIRWQPGFPIAIVDHLAIETAIDKSSRRDLVRVHWERPAVRSREHR